MHRLGIAVAVAVHLGIGAAIASANGARSGEHFLLPAHIRARLAMQDAVVIEATLAFRANQPRASQPQKRPTSHPRRPDPVQVTTRTDAPPQKSRKSPKPDAVDINAVMNRHRADIDLAEERDDQDSQQAVPQLGHRDGSEWGTAAEAKGDPYVGELHGRIKKVWELPTLETGKGATVGCVRLDKAGAIVDRTLKQKSGIRTLDSSVRKALRNASKMKRPVPAHLVFLLTEKGICFRFKPGG